MFHPDPEKIRADHAGGGCLAKLQGKIEHLFSPATAVSAQTQAHAKVTLYATDWCGYCKQTRRFLDSKGIP